MGRLYRARLNKVLAASRRLRRSRLGPGQFDLGVAQEGVGFQRDKDPGSAGAQLAEARDEVAAQPVFLVVAGTVGEAGDLGVTDRTGLGRDEAQGALGRGRFDRLAGLELQLVDLRAVEEAPVVLAERGTADSIWRPRKHGHRVG